MSIAFLGSPWGALDVEVSDPEIDPLVHARKEIDGDLVQFGAFFGFGGGVKRHLARVDREECRNARILLTQRGD